MGSSVTPEQTISVRFLADLKGLLEGFALGGDAVKTGVAEMKATTAELGDLAGMISGPFLALSGILAGGAMFKGAISATMDWNNTALSLARTLGITTEQASALNVALEESFVSTDTYTRAVQMLTRGIATGGKGLAELGISAKDANGNLKPTPELMTEVVDNLNSLKEGTDRNVAGVEVFGRSWSTIQPILQMSGERMAESKAKAEALGLEVGGAAFAAAQRYRSAMVDVSEIIKAFALQIGGALLPVLTDLTSFLNDHVEDALETLRSGIGLISLAFDTLKFIVVEVSDAFIGWINIIAGPLDAVLAAVWDALHGRFAEARADLKVGFTGIADDFRDMLTVMNTDLTTYSDRAAALMPAIRGQAPPRGPSTKVGVQGPDALDLPDTGQAAAEAKANAWIDAIYAHELEAAKNSYADQRRILESKLEYAKETYGEESAEYEKAQTEILKLDQQQAVDQAKLEEESTNRWLDSVFKQKKGAVDAFAGIEQAWRTSAQGMLAGTQTFAGTMSSLWQSVGAMIDQSIAHMVSQWYAAHLKMGAIHLEMQLKRVAVHLWADASTLASTIATGLKEIAVHAAKAAAAAAAAIAGIPIIGPFLAAGAAAAMLAGVLALGHNLPSAAGGWGQVPFDTLAMVHQNEMVLPASLAQNVRDMTGDGGNTYNFTIHATDAASFAGLLDRHDGVLVKKLHEIARNGRLG